MGNLTSHIIKLLHEHNYVVVPDFGGFVANYRSSEINTLTSVIYPPNKQIVFNPKLLKDDGLLLHEIMNFEKMDYEEAVEYLKHGVAVWQDKIMSEGKVILNGLGLLQRNDQNTLIFIQEKAVNFLKDSFGLSPLNFQKNKKHSPDRIFIDRKLDKQKKVRQLPVYLVLIPFILVFTILYFQWDQLNNKYEYQSGFEYFSSLKENLNDEQVLEEENNQDKPIQNHEAVLEVDLKSTESTIPEEPIIENELARVFNYCIIGGAFREETNAKKFISELEAKGFEAKMAGLTSTGLHMISYFDTDDLNEARTQLRLIKKAENSSAWLLVKEK